MTTGALFRSELGIPVEGDPAGRRRLSSEELALALGATLERQLEFRNAPFHQYRHRKHGA